MNMTPLKQWICDTFGELIEKPGDGWLEWQHDGKGTFSVSNFRICHHVTASPRRGDDPEGCYHHRERRLDDHLHHVLGDAGMVRMLSKLDPGPIIDPKGKSIGGVSDLRNWTDTFRRLFIPYYEEARQYFGKAKADGFFDEMNELAVYSESTLKRVIEEYGN